MNFFESIINFIEFSLFGKFYYFIRKIILKKYNDKKRTILRNSSHSNGLFYKIFKNYNLENIKSIFFNMPIFSYSNPDLKEEIINLINLGCSEQKDFFIEKAEKIIENKFSIFEKEYKFNTKINWHYSFFNDFYWKLDPIEKINIRPVYEHKNIDVKYVWELNRHQFLLYLGFAYFITGNNKYARKFKILILDWIKKNPFLYGINWYSGLEISIRLINWIYCLYFFKSSEIINNLEFFKKILKSMICHIFYLRNFPSIQTFNHKIGELFGLFFFYKIFEKIPSINNKKKKISQKLKRQLFMQIKPDGVYLQQSINYHKFVLEFYILFYLLNSENISHQELVVIKRMLYFLMSIRKPNLVMPSIGDSDDSILLPLSSKNPAFCEDIFNIGTILFENEYFKFCSEKISLSSILIFGIKGYKTFKSLDIKIPGKKNFFFPLTGYYIFRNNWLKKSNYLLVDFTNFGPLGAAHSHSDCTNIFFSCGGEDIIIDSGTYNYNKSWRIRSLFRSSIAHNVLTIDNKNQAKIIDWFKWKNKPKIKSFIKRNNSSSLLFCSHDGYKGFKVFRKIQVNEEVDFINIHDEILPSAYKFKKKNHRISVSLHFNKNLVIKRINNTLIINNKIKIEFNSNQNFKMHLAEFYYSPHYGKICKNKVLNINTDTNFKEVKKIEIKTKISQI